MRCVTPLAFGSGVPRVRAWPFGPADAADFGRYRGRAAPALHQSPGGIIAGIALPVNTGPVGMIAGTFAYAYTLGEHFGAPFFLIVFPPKWHVFTNI